MQRMAGAPPFLSIHRYYIFDESLQLYHGYKVNKGVAVFRWLLRHRSYFRYGMFYCWYVGTSVGYSCSFF